MDILETKRDVDIKFGSRNLLSFGGMQNEKENFKDIEDRILEEINHKF